MHRRHRRQLIGVEPGHRAVDRLPVAYGGVDHAVAGEHAGRCHRDELDEQRRHGEQHQRRPHLWVVPAVPDVHPDQAPDDHHEVEPGVVEVECLHDQRMRQERQLDGRLARQMNGPLGLPDPLPTVDRAVRAHQHE